MMKNEKAKEREKEKENWDAWMILDGYVCMCGMIR